MIEDAGSGPDSTTGESRRAGLRGLARASAALFLLSSTFPIVAGATNQQQPLGWLGTLDVSVAAVLVCVAALLTSRARASITAAHRLAALRVTHGISYVIPVLLAVYFVAGARVNWAVVVIGLAWRGWLLIAVLPSVVAGLEKSPTHPLLRGS